MTSAYIAAIRVGADWRYSDQGWHSPDGEPEAQWVAAGLPLPEDPTYPDFAEAYWHYDATDSGELPVLLAQAGAVRLLQQSWSA